jgi:hypothetical protein
VLPLAPLFPPPQIGRLRCHAKTAVLVLVIDLVGVLTQVAVEIWEHPEGVMLRINGAGEQARPLCCLRVAQKRVDELIIGRLE